MNGKDNTRVSTRKVPDILEEIKLQARAKELNRLKANHYQLSGIDGDVSNDTRTSYERNADYWDPVKGMPSRMKASVENGTNPLLSLGKTVIPAAAIASGAYAPAITALKGASAIAPLMGLGAIQGLGWNMLTGNQEDPIKAAVDGASAELVGPILNKVADKAVSAYKINNAISKGSKEFDGTVGEAYFRDPHKWYRITESPEIYGIREAGRNITTSDMAELGMTTSADRFRTGIIKAGLVPVDGGWALSKNAKPGIRLATKAGSAHGNTSQAALGGKWGGSIASSKKFPQVVLEGQGVNKVGASYDALTGADQGRSVFTKQDWSDLPIGARLGFKTGEMPLENLKAFTKLKNGRYSFEDVIPYKTAEVPAFSSEVVPTKKIEF